MEILLAVLTMILMPQFIPDEMIEKVSFAELPEVCAAAYDPFQRKEREAVNTDVIRFDFDGDSKKELIVWNGDSGSGGEGWVIFKELKPGKWTRIGEVFGLLSLVKHQMHNGLLVCSPNGWDSAKWQYYELEREKLVCRYEVSVKYRKPIREKPESLSIKILP